jgi:hypothetical protein
VNEPTPGEEGKAFLWVIAGLIGTLELTWWLFDRIYQT